LSKERLDVLLVNRGLFQSREKARASIMAGIVAVDGNREDKPGSRYEADCSIDIKQNINPYVSRGGLKLEKALAEFSIDLKGCTVMDVGASTGGFTDCMLKNGAEKVYSIDVGYGQLAWELRNNPKVVNMERTNIRYVGKEQISDSLDFATVDVSFISLKKVLPVLALLLKESGHVICLIKPQFEAGREKVGKHGVVRDIEVHRKVVSDIVEFSAGAGFCSKGLTFSPVKGPEGNIEYLLYIEKNQNSERIINQLEIDQVVEDSHKILSE